MAPSRDGDDIWSIASWDKRQFHSTPLQAEQRYVIPKRFDVNKKESKKKKE
jgi:hypothetical protein